MSATHRASDAAPRRRRPAFTDRGLHRGVMAFTLSRRSSPGQFASVSTRASYAPARPTVRTTPVLRACKIPLGPVCRGTPGARGPYRVRPAAESRGSRALEPRSGPPSRGERPRGGEGAATRGKGGIEGRRVGQSRLRWGTQRASRVGYAARRRGRPAPLARRPPGFPGPGRLKRIGRGRRGRPGRHGHRIATGRGGICGPALERKRAADERGAEPADAPTGIRSRPPGRPAQHWSRQW
jgi:hypothetical protein